MQFRPVVSDFFLIFHSNACDYLLIIRHLSLIAKDFCITKHERFEAMLFLAACYFGIAHFRYQSFILHTK